MVVSYPSTCGSVASPVTKSSVLKYQVTVGQLFRSQVKLAKRILFSLCLSLCIFLKINSMYSAAVKLLSIDLQSFFSITTAKEHKTLSILY